MNLGEVIEVLEDEDFGKVSFQYSSEKNGYIAHYFEGYTDSEIEIRVDVFKKYLDIYTRYPEEKHFTKENTINFT